MLRIEGELERLAGELADPDGERVRELSAAYGELEAALPPAYERWERAQTAGSRQRTRDNARERYYNRKRGYPCLYSIPG